MSSYMEIRLVFNFLFHLLSYTHDSWYCCGAYNMQNTINGRTTDGRTDRLIPENIMTPPPILRWRRHKNVVNRCIRLHATVLSNVKRYKFTKTALSVIRTTCDGHIGQAIPSV